MLLARIINIFSKLIHSRCIFDWYGICVWYTNLSIWFFSTKNYLLLKHSSAQCQLTMWIICRTTNTYPKKKSSFQLKIFTLWHDISFLFSFSRLPCCRGFLLFFHSFILSIRVLLCFVLVHCSKTTIQYSSRNLCIAAVVHWTH